jgi:hypothetical protein
MSRLGLWNPAKKLDKAGVTRDKAERSNMSGMGPDISELGLWNAKKESDKAKRPNMSGLGAGHVRPVSLESVLGAEYV